MDETINCLNNHEFQAGRCKVAMGVLTNGEAVRRKMLEFTQMLTGENKSIGIRGTPSNDPSRRLRRDNSSASNSARTDLIRPQNSPPLGIIQPDENASNGLHSRESEKGNAPLHSHDLRRVHSIIGIPSNDRSRCTVRPQRLRRAHSSASNSARTASIRPQNSLPPPPRPSPLSIDRN